MRTSVTALGLLLAALSVPAGLGQDAWPPGHHSPHVAAFTWTPAEPQRGQPFNAQATLQDGGDPAHVLLRICRVEGYSCRSPLEMTSTNATAPRPVYSVTAPWEPAFYRGVDHVGLAVILDFRNGTTEESPTTPWPGPMPLPDGGGSYYFFTLPPEAKPAPAASIACLIVALAVVALGRRP